MKKKVVGIIMIALTLSVLILWETWGEEQFIYDEILTLKNDVYEGEEITSDMIKVIRVEKPNERVLRPKDIYSLCQMRSRNFIPKGEAIYWDFFQPNTLSYRPNTSLNVLSVPPSWLIDMPQSIKRGDKAIFYVDGSLILEATVIHVKTEDNEEIKYSDLDRLNASGKIERFEILASVIDIDILSNLAEEGKKFLVTYR